ncbi:MAG: biopolymer transporter ExbD [Kiritimatiellae bacterium]|nr:biopolymer transporter ExbD [Kiritimatiellia bacterium]MBR4946377.1 biopolymer transporter ExbD [Kiritimatiellia bacterium]MBR5587392.1 biopolymer transporter ExbD [Kiritimatiellia bacterium]
MAKKKERVKSEGVALDMTPMIDVVFQLIIFFVVTLKQEDILSHLDAMAPSPDSKATPAEKIEMVTIDIYNPKQGGEGFLMNKTPVSYKQLDSEIRRAARNNKGSTVLLRCTKDSPHSLLVKALDLCNKYGMTNLAIFSL